MRGVRSNTEHVSRTFLGCVLTSQSTVTYSFAMTPIHRERTLHLIDIENLTGTASPTAEEVRDCRDLYESTFVGDGDLVVVACSHHAFRVVGWEWPSARHLLRSGENGADLALLDVIVTEDVARRFDFVHVASGDGIFAGAAASLAAAGVTVTAVSRPESLSAALRLAACRHELLPSLINPVTLPLESA